MNSIFNKGDLNAAQLKYIGTACETLGLNALFGSDIAGYFTADAGLIRLRLEIMHDMLEIDGLKDALAGLQSLLKEYGIYDSMKKGNDIPELLSRLTGIRLYLSIIDSAADAFAPFYPKLKSGLLISLADSFINEQKSAEYRTAKENSAEINEKYSSVKSITVGVNLGTNFQPTEAGLVAVNGEYYKSGSFIDRLLRFDFKKNDFNCLSPLTTVEAADIPGEDQVMMNRAVLRVMNNVFSGSLKKCSTETKKYIDAKLREYYAILPDITFLIRAAEVYSQFREKRIPVCYPKISEMGEYSIHGIINPRLTFVKSIDKIVPNDIRFDSEGTVYILTGPNSGGKSVFINALGEAQLMFQLGLPVLAVSATLPVLDGVFLQFPRVNAKEMIKNEAGRLEEECREISGILDAATGNSLVLLDETFSSTNSKDSVVLASNTVERLSKKGCRAVFSTHIHELVDTVTGDGGAVTLSGVDLLAAEIRDNVNTYRIVRGRAEKTGDALIIARKYGLL